MPQAPSIADAGSQLAVIGTEHFLAGESVVGVFVLSVDLGVLQAGDSVEIRVKTRAHAASAMRTLYSETFSDAQTPEANVQSVPAVVTHEIEVTLKQIAGVARTFDWELIQL